MLLHLYENAGKDKEKAQRGIIVVDEIDKKYLKEIMLHSHQL